MALIWDVAEFITLCARGGKLGIHPGAHVGLHLVLWLGFGCGVGWLGAIAAYDYCDSYCRRYRSQWETAQSSRNAVLAFMALLL